VVARWLRPERFDDFFAAVTAAIDRDGVRRAP
jgi:hypothetical protein